MKARTRLLKFSVYVSLMVKRNNAGFCLCRVSFGNIDFTPLVDDLKL